MELIAPKQDENSRSMKGKKALTEGRANLGVLQSTENTRGRHDPSKQKKAKKISQKKTFSIFQDAASKKKSTPEHTEMCEHAEVQTESEQCCHCICHGNQPSNEPDNEHSNEEKAEHEQLNAEEEAHRLLVQDDVGEDYYQQLAETRREALEESLIENEILHTTIDELKEENRRLSELAEHAEYFANILKSMNGDDTESNDNQPASPASSSTEQVDNAHVNSNSPHEDSSVFDS